MKAPQNTAPSPNSPTISIQLNPRGDVSFRLSPKNSEHFLNKLPPSRPSHQCLLLTKHSDQLSSRQNAYTNPDLLSVSDSAAILTQNLDQFLGGRSPRTHTLWGSSVLALTGCPGTPSNPRFPFSVFCGDRRNVKTTAQFPLRRVDKITVIPLAFLE